MNNYITKYSEAKDEADRLSRTLKRTIKAKAVDCDCDYSRDCFICGGSGTWYDLVFASCSHSVGDGEMVECDANDCVRKEREAAMVERVETFPRVGAQIVSCRDKAIEQAESEAA